MIENMKFSRYSSVSKEKIAVEIDVLGFDTETLDGYCRLICNSRGQYVYSKDIISILEFLTRPEYHKVLKVFYNLKYDVQAIIKYLPKDKLIDLAFAGETKIDKYVLRYIAEKVFTIKAGGRLYKYYDIAQFYHMSLDTAGNKYLGMAKTDVDVSNLTERDFDPSNTLFRDYCIRDCLICEKLARRLQSKFVEMGVSFNAPISSARLSEIYALNKYWLPPFKLTNFQRLYHDSYAGGRFEIIKRGYAEDVYLYDINSAYPEVIKDLPHMDYVTPYKTSRVGGKYSFGVYRVRIIYCDEPILSPLWKRLKGLMIFPNSFNSEYTLTQKELEYIDRYTNIEYEVLYGYGLRVWDKVKPFKWIEELYKIRKEVEQEDVEMAQTIKIIMNSLYGKFLQNTTVYSKAEFTAEGDILRLIDEDVAVAYERSVKAGYLFNPFYASTITANTRIKLLEACYGHFDEVIAMHTDSIAMSAPRIRTKEGLGNWSLDGEGEGIFVNTGMYTIRGDEKVKNKFRGGSNVLEKDWFKICRDNYDRSEIVLEHTRPLGLKETILHNRLYTTGDLNRFITRRKVFNIAHENKRQWAKPIDHYGVLLSEQIVSRPREHSTTTERSLT